MAGTPRLSPLVVSLLMVLLTAAAVDGEFDCRRFVFAPQCRGMISKRDGGYPMIAYRDYIGFLNDLPVEDYATSDQDNDDSSDTNNLTGEEKMRGPLLRTAYTDGAYADPVPVRGSSNLVFVPPETPEYSSQQDSSLVQHHGVTGRRNLKLRIGHNYPDTSARQLQHTDLSSFVRRLMPTVRRDSTRR